MENQPIINPPTNNKPLTPNNDRLVSLPETSSSKTTTFMGIVIVILLGIVGFLGYQFFTIKTMLEAPNKIASEPEAKREEIAPTQTPLVEKAKETEAANITSMNEVWNLYSDPALGFSIQVPKNMTEAYGDCKYQTTKGDHSYRPEEAEVPTAVHETKTGAYITAAFFYELKGMSKENNTSYFSDCQKTETSTALISEREALRKTNPAAGIINPRFWEIKIAEVANETDLEKFVKANYGVGCKVGAKTENKNGYQDVKIDGDGKDLEISECPINYIYVLKYSSTLNRAATWGVGQDVVFSGNKYQDIYNADMINSFNFL